MDSEPDLHSFHSLSFILFLSAFTPGLIFSIVLVIVFLFFSALLSSSEVAYFSLSPDDIKDLKEEESPASNRIISLRETPRRLLATILIGNNFINIGIVIISDFILRNSISFDALVSMSQSGIDALGIQGYISAYTISRVFNFIIAVVGVTFLLVLFGEVAPKVYARYNNIGLAKIMSRPLIVINKMLYPVSSIMVGWTDLMETRFQRRLQNSGTSKKEIDKAIEMTVSNEVDSKREIDFLKSIVAFGDVTVKQIMKPRVDVVAVDFRIGYKELLKIAIDSGYSRIPVFDEDFDSVTGILYVKELLGHLQEDEKYEWQELIRTDVMYVPETKKINDLLKSFQAEKMHIGVVVDEYGGSAGIVTLEDIMEEVIGDIKDEFDDQIEIEYRKVDDYNYVFEGKTLLNDVCRTLDIDMDTFDEMKGDADSFAGLILEVLGELPKIGNKVKVDGYIFEILEVGARRIKQIKITLPEK